MIEHWEKHGACNGGKTGLDFFALDPASVKACKAVCRVCPVRPECREFAMTSGQEHGVWGMTTPDERARVAGRK